MMLMKSRIEKDLYSEKCRTLRMLLLKSGDSKFLVEEALNILVDIVGDVDLTVISLSMGSAKLISTTILNQDNLDLLMSMIDFYLASETGKLLESIKIRKRPDVIETRAVPLSCGSIVNAYLLIDLYDKRYTDITKIEEVYDIFSMIVRLNILEHDIEDAYEKDALTQLKTRDALIDILNSIIADDEVNARENFFLGLAHLKNAAELNKGGVGSYVKVDQYLKEMALRIVRLNNNKVYRLCGTTFAFLIHKDIMDACRQATVVLDELSGISPELEISVLVGRLKSDGLATIYNCEKHSDEAEADSVTVYANTTTPEEDEEFKERALRIRSVDTERIRIIEDKKQDKKPAKDVERMEGEVVDSVHGTDILYGRSKEDEEQYTQTFIDLGDTEDTVDEKIDIDMNGEGLEFSDDDIGTKSINFVTKVNRPFRKKGT